MPWMPDGPEVDTADGKIGAWVDEDGKLQGFQRISDSSEQYGSYYIDGEVAFLMAMKHSPRGPVGKGRRSDLLRNLHITLSEFQNLCQCRMSGSEYHALMVQKQLDGQLPSDPRA